ncbi:Zinc finger RING-type [Penicillium capsulatum]|uniref:Zinc finger RING-type n=1 Tax=Penicillium capsulatum TaxID=69766 RepID=A0A9W9LFH1_9EURO|nr:Zinc finger RING-type [Penicillium capsulatum]KAJ6112978.1 Zinc finger RING-type [Penicillium capsulatum]
MSTSAATASTSVSDPPRPGRLRRLSQLRAYTHLSSPGQRSRRSSLSSRVPFLSSSGPDTPSHVGHSTPCPDTDHPALSRYTSAPSPHGAIDGPASPDASQSTDRTQTTHAMARLRSASAVQGRPPRTLGRTATSEAPTSSPEPAAPATGAPEVATAGPAETPTNDPTEDTANPSKLKQKATIRFFPYQDTYQSSRPSLPFVPVTRTLPSESCVVRVGRYSERDGIPTPNPTEPSDAPVGFKSKVVSRKHCEFMYMNGQWHVKDVGSSSGTFLNHMRLSQPNMPSRLYSIKDGDIVQLGIDFRGGEEMIFRCVRIRIECNRSWQQQPNEFNKNTESLIKNLGKGETADYSGCRECSICLGSVLRPYQCLFMAACAHVWHYKCISPLLNSPDFPMFQCPNCRAFTDLSAEVDDSNDYEGGEQEKGESVAPADSEAPGAAAQAVADASATNGDERPPSALESHPEETDLVTDVENLHLQDDQRPEVDTEDTGSSASPAPNGSSDDLARTAASNIPGWQPTQPLNVPAGSARLRADTPVRSETSDENPLTPRNDQGPLAFDGRAGMQRHGATEGNL